MMDICIDYRNISNDSYSAYCAQLLVTAILAGNAHTRILLLCGDATPAIPPTQRVEPVTLKKTMGLLNRTRWWQQKSITHFSKARQPQLFITFNHWPDAAFSGKKIIFITEKLPVFLQALPAGTTLVFTSPFLKNVFEAAHPAHQASVLECYGLYQKMKPPAPVQSWKEKYTGGREYFLCTDFNMPEAAWVLLLKAFSLFKKRQQSEWKLAIVPRSKAAYSQVQGLIQNYKYREDIVLAEAQALPALLAEAYALVSINGEEIFPAAVFEAHQCGTPVLAAHTQALQETTGAAVLFAPEATPEALAEEMMFLYKDENYKHLLLQQAPQALAQYPAKAAMGACMGLLRQLALF